MSSTNKKVITLADATTPSSSSSSSSSSLQSSSSSSSSLSSLSDSSSSSSSSSPSLHEHSDAATPSSSSSSYSSSLTPSLLNDRELRKHYRDDNNDIDDDNNPQIETNDNNEKPDTIEYDIDEYDIYGDSEIDDDDSENDNDDDETMIQVQRIESVHVTDVEDYDNEVYKDGKGSSKSTAQLADEAKPIHSRAQHDDDDEPMMTEVEKVNTAATIESIRQRFTSSNPNVNDRLMSDCIQSIMQFLHRSDVAHYGTASMNLYKEMRTMGQDCGRAIRYYDATLDGDYNHLVEDTEAPGWMDGTVSWNRWGIDKLLYGVEERKRLHRDAPLPGQPLSGYVQFLIIDIKGKLVDIGRTLHRIAAAMPNLTRVRLMLDVQLVRVKDDAMKNVNHIIASTFANVTKLYVQVTLHAYQNEAARHNNTSFGCVVATNNLLVRLFPAIHTLSFHIEHNQSFLCRDTNIAPRNDSSRSFIHPWMHHPTLRSFSINNRIDADNVYDVKPIRTVMESIRNLVDVRFSCNIDAPGNRARLLAFFAEPNAMVPYDRAFDDAYNEVDDGPDPVENQAFFVPSLPTPVYDPLANTGVDDISEANGGDVEIIKYLYRRKIVADIELRDPDTVGEDLHTMRDAFLDMNNDSFPHIDDDVISSCSLPLIGRIRCLVTAVVVNSEVSDLLTRMSNLRKLHLQRIDNIDFVVHLNQLHELSMDDNVVATSVSSVALVDALRQCTQMVSLKIGHRDINDVQITHMLSAMLQLRRLEIERSPLITSLQFVNDSHLNQHIVTLRFDDMSFASNSVEVRKLRNMMQLKKMYIQTRYNQINIRMRYYNRNRLERLTIDQHNFPVLELIQMNVNDAYIPLSHVSPSPSSSSSSSLSSFSSSSSFVSSPSSSVSSSTSSSLSAE